MDREPNARIFADSAENEPTKPSKPGSVGFEGATFAEPTEIEWQISPPVARGEKC
jgi:hypothetical protein